MKITSQSVTLRPSQIKELVKESLEEKREMFYDVMYEVVEDICLANAIEKGKKTRFVRRESIFKILDSKR